MRRADGSGRDEFEPAFFGAGVTVAHERGEWAGIYPPEAFGLRQFLCRFGVGDGVQTPMLQPGTVPSRVTQLHSAEYSAHEDRVSQTLHRTSRTQSRIG